MIAGNEGIVSHNLFVFKQLWIFSSLVASVARRVVHGAPRDTTRRNQWHKESKQHVPKRLPRAGKTDRMLLDEACAKGTAATGVVHSVHPFRSRIHGAAPAARNWARGNCEWRATKQSHWAKRKESD